MKLLNNRLIAVTGAGSGNGKALAHGLADYGAKIIALDINIDSASTTATKICENGGNAWSYQLDITNSIACKEVAAKISTDLRAIDVLINNAGIIRRNSIEDEDACQAWQDCIDVNATGAFNMAIAFANQLRSTKGNIINMTSITAFVSAKTFPGYSASKAAVVAMTRAMAATMAEDEVRVNAVAPGPFSTPMTASTLANKSKENYYTSRVLLGRFGDPEEIVGPVAFMASEMASFVTGTTLVVDGGFLAE